MIDIEKLLELAMCRLKHGKGIEYNRTSRLINTGMGKEITIYYRCPVCGLEWRTKEYV